MGNAAWSGAEAAGGRRAGAGLDGEVTVEGLSLVVAKGGEGGHTRGVDVT